MNCIRIILFNLLLLFTQGAFAQMFQQWSPPVTANNETLELAFAGGLNSPQFSEVDLNNDGILDLYVFDKVGNVHLTFLNHGTSGQPGYSFAPEYAGTFPYLNNWALLRDFDNDGAMDIFSHSTIPGIFAIEVYKGRYENNRLHFSKMHFSEGSFDIIYYKQTSGNFTNLYVSNIDIPAIDDVDGDGDLDILTFSVAGGYLEYFKNESVEKGYSRDSLKFVFEDNCWGKFFESGLTPAVTLSDNNTVCATNFRLPNRRHAGSTVAVFDEDNDGVVEVLLGDVSFSNLVKLNNGGDKDQAFITGQDVSFPSYDVTTEINVFPAAFFIDVDNDGKKDMLAAPNSKSGENYEVGWWYKNVSSTESPDFELQQKDFLVGEMIDVGSGAHPVFVDYNADGLKDLIIGSGGFFLPGGQRDARLFLYENIGTISQASFKLVDDNYLNFKQFTDQFNTFAPAFGDLDNDNDLDLLVGEFNGTLFFVKNTAGPNKTFTFDPIQPNFMNIDVGQASKPQIADINNDGLADLVIGERNGNVNYLQNIGSQGNPMFNPILTESPNTDFFGSVDERGRSVVTGFTSPRIVKDENDFLMITGTEDRGLTVYSDVADNIYNTFSKSEEAWGEVQVGERIHPALADLDNDGFFEMVVGNNRGGLSGFETDLKSGEMVPVENIVNELEIKLFPNPAKDHLVVEWKHDVTQLEVFNLLGQSLLRLSPNEKTVKINLNKLDSGVYLMVLEGEEGRIAKRFIVK